MSTATDVRASVREMIAAAGIQRIVCVDDSFAETDVGSLIERLSGFTPEQRAELLQVSAEEMSVDDIWQSRVSEVWEGMSPGAHANLVDNAAALDHGLEPVRTGFAEIIGEACPDSEFEHLSMAEWRQKMKEVVDGVLAAPTLILFDQDFRNEGGAEKEGQKLVAQLEREIKDQADVKLETFYGILTNTVSIDQEHVRRTEIVEEADLDPGRFVLISKQSLRDSASSFPERLRPILLAPLFSRLMESVGGAVVAAQGAARKRAVEIAPEDLEQMVVRTSNYEGVWPLDTLLRILETMQREAVRRSLREEDGLVSLTERVEALTNVILPTHPVESAPDEDSGRAEEKSVERVPAAARISNEEIYEKADHLNSLHMPVSLGDLFKNTETGVIYVLIAQPCNLMVRKKGRRAHEPSHMLLAKVAPGASGGKVQFKLFELPYFDLETGESWFVHLNGPVVARTWVLDACVLDAKGASRLDLQSEEPPALLPHWKERRRKLYRQAETLLEGVAELPAETSLGLETRNALGGSFKADPFPLTDFSVENQLLAWGCERIGRVRDPYARALLSRFSQFFARDAYLHDLAQG